MWNSLSWMKEVHAGSLCVPGAQKVHTRAGVSTHPHSNILCTYMSVCDTNAHGIVCGRRSSRREPTSETDGKDNSQEKVIGRWISSSRVLIHTHANTDMKYCYDDTPFNSSRLCAAAFCNWFKRTEAITLIPSIMRNGSSNSPLLVSYIYTL